MIYFHVENVVRKMMVILSYLNVLKAYWHKLYDHQRLTHYGLETPYDDIGLGQHRLR